MALSLLARTLYFPAMLTHITLLVSKKVFFRVVSMASCSHPVPSCFRSEFFFKNRCFKLLVILLYNCSVGHRKPMYVWIHMIENDEPFFFICRTIKNISFVKGFPTSGFARFPLHLRLVWRRSTYMYFSIFVWLFTNKHFSDRKLCASRYLHAKRS